MLLLGWGSMAGAQSVGISSPSHGELLLNTSAFYRGAPDYDIEVRGAAAIPKGTLNHVTTPMFSRMDIDDPLGEQQFVTYGLYPSQDDYWAAQFDQLQLYATYGPGVGGLEPPDEPHGVQGPRCRRHVAIQTNDGFYRHTVSNPGVVLLSFYDLLVNWLTNSAGPDTVQIQNDLLGPGSYTPSFCP